MRRAPIRLIYRRAVLAARCGAGSGRSPGCLPTASCCSAGSMPVAAQPGPSSSPISRRRWAPPPSPARNTTPRRRRSTARSTCSAAATSASSTTSSATTPARGRSPRRARSRRRRPTSPSPRSAGSAYIVGGFDGTNWLDSILAWRPGAPPRVVARLPTGLRYAAATTVGGDVVIIGGSTPSGASEAIYRFDPRTGTVVQIGRMSAPGHPRHGGRAERDRVPGGRAERQPRRTDCFRLGDRPHDGPRATRRAPSATPFRRRGPGRGRRDRRRRRTHSRRPAVRRRRTRADQLEGPDPGGGCAPSAPPRPPLGSLLGPVDVFDDRRQLLRVQPRVDRHLARELTAGSPDRGRNGAGRRPADGATRCRSANDSCCSPPGTGRRR